MANQVDGGTKANGVVSGLDQEELTVREKMAKDAQAADKDPPYGPKLREPCETSIATGDADDAFGTAAGEPEAP